MSELIKLIGRLVEVWIENLELQNKRLRADLRTEESTVIHEATPAAENKDTKENKKPKQNEKQKQQDNTYVTAESAEWVLPTAGGRVETNALRVGLSTWRKNGKIPYRIFADTADNKYYHQYLYHPEDVKCFTAHRDMACKFNNAMKTHGMIRIREAANGFIDIGNKDDRSYSKNYSALMRYLHTGCVPAIRVDKEWFVHIDQLSAFNSWYDLWYCAKDKQATRQMLDEDYASIPLAVVAWTAFRRFEILTEGMTENERILVSHAIIDSSSRSMIRDGEVFVDSRDVKRVLENLKPTEEM